MYSFLINSTYGIVGATFERFFAVVYPIWHKARFRRKQAAMIILVSWLIGPVMYIPLSVSTSGLTADGACSVYYNYGTRDLQRFSGVSSLIIVYFFPLVIMFYFYARMIVIFRRKVSHFADDIHVYNVQSSAKLQLTNSAIKECIETNSEQNDNCKECSTKGDKKGITNVEETSLGENSRLGIKQLTPACVEQINANKVTTAPTAPKESASTARARHSIIKTLVIVTFGFMLCSSWNDIYFLMFHLGYTHVDFTGVFYNFTVVMMFVSCCINPIIYCVKFKQFQNGVKWVFRCVTQKITNISQYADSQF